MESVVEARYVKDYMRFNGITAELTGLSRGD
jgi:hypothetical protein